MKAEIIATGSELTSGDRLNTNAQWLSKKLTGLGIEVGWHTVLADDLKDNIDALQVARGRADLILMTGGLGPTQDDVTREALAAAAGVSLEFHEPSFTEIKKIFAVRSIAMPERNRVQAFFPSGSEPLPNPFGTAPGIWLQHQGRLFIALPGVPREMHTMFEHQVTPRLKAQLGAARHIVQRRIHCYGAGESAVEEKLFDLTRRGAFPEVGITASEAVITLRIRATGTDQNQALEGVARAEKAIRERMSDMVFGVDDETLAEVVVRALHKREESFCVVESFTAGHLASRVSLAMGAEQVFRGGATFFDPRLAAEFLGIEKAHEDFMENAKILAEGARAKFNATYALYTAGFPLADRDRSLNNRWQVALVLADGKDARAETWSAATLHKEAQLRVANFALNLLRLRLIV